MEESLLLHCVVTVLILLHCSDLKVYGCVGLLPYRKCACLPASFLLFVLAGFTIRWSFVSEQRIHVVSKCV